MKDCEEVVDCTGRREFLVKAAFLAGGLVLSLKGAGSVRAAAVNDLVVTIDDGSPLNKVGGSAIVDSPGGKIIVLRTGDASFVAYSAICTHKRGVVEYDPAKKLFVCPKHGSTFNTATGDPVDGPADDPLPSFKTKGSAGSVTITVGS